MSKKILLINPWIYDFAAYDFWIKPLGLLYLGAVLRQNNHEIHFIDCLDPYNPRMCQRKNSKLKRRSSGDGKFFRQVIEKPEALRPIPRSYCRYGIDPDIFRSELREYKDVDLILITSIMTYWYPGVLISSELSGKKCRKFLLSWAANTQRCVMIMPCNFPELIL